jgi:hypothetical protein
METERLIIGDKKFLHIIPDQMKIIVDRMLMAVNNSKKPVETLDFSEFRKFLDLNPGIRQIITDSLRPSLWSITESTMGVNNKSGFGCMAPTRSGAKNS